VEERNDFRFIVADVMRKDIISLPPDRKVKEAAELMEERGVSSLVVESKDGFIGILTDKDFVRCVREGRQLSRTKVEDIMSTDLVSIDSKASLAEAAELIAEHNIRHLLVKAGGRYVGIVSVKDVLSRLYEELKEQNARLKKKLGELEKFYRVAVDRELIMVKLKKRIRELEEKVGEKKDLAEYLAE